MPPSSLHRLMDLEKGEKPTEEDSNYYKHFYTDVEVEIRNFIKMFNHCPFNGLLLTTFIDARRDREFVFQVTSVQYIHGLCPELKVAVKYKG